MKMNGIRKYSRAKPINWVRSRLGPYAVVLFLIEAILGFLAVTVTQHAILLTLVMGTLFLLAIAVVTVIIVRSTAAVAKDVKRDTCFEKRSDYAKVIQDLRGQLIGAINDLLHKAVGPPSVSEKDKIQLLRILKNLSIKLEEKNSSSGTRSDLDHVISMQEALIQISEAVKELRKASGEVVHDQHRGEVGNTSTETPDERKLMSATPPSGLDITRPNEKLW